MRPSCFSPLKTELIFKYEWIKCFDVWGEQWVYYNVYCLKETETAYYFKLNTSGEIVWPVRILPRIDYGPKYLLENDEIG